MGVLSRLMPPRANCGRKPLDRRAVVNAILYVLLTGCQWRALPKDFPKWSSVYTIYRRWKLDGTWVRIHDTLRERCRQAAGKKRTFTVAIIDSQPAQTTNVASDQRATMPGKTQGPQAASGGGHAGLGVEPGCPCGLDSGSRWSTWIADQTERTLPPLEGDLRRLGVQPQRLARLDASDVRLDSANHPPPRGPQAFRGAPQRWIVERTFSWITCWRRFAKHYERHPDNSETLIYIRMIHLMSKRLATAKM